MKLLRWSRMLYFNQKITIGLYLWLNGIWNLVNLAEKNWLGDHKWNLVKPSPEKLVRCPRTAFHHSVESADTYWVVWIQLHELLSAQMSPWHIYSQLLLWIKHIFQIRQFNISTKFQRHSCFLRYFEPFRN